MDTLISTEGIAEAISNFVDPREPFTDSPGFGWMSRKMGYYTRIDDRADGRYSPIYDDELDLNSIRMAAWLMDAEVPVAKAMKARLVDYTIASGFDWEITHESKQIEQVLNDAITNVLENIEWEGLEVESFERELVDGEFLAEFTTSMGDISLEVLEGTNLTEPLDAGDLENWKQMSFPTSWSFGVLTREGSTTPRGYHVVRNATGSDWDLVEPDMFVHWKRNVPRNAKRGASDHFTTHKWLNYGNKVLSNTAQGAAIQAAIAYIVEHASGVTAGQAAALASARSNVVVKNDPITGEAYKSREVRPGQVVDINNGGKYHSGLLGSNNSNIYIEVMESLFRLSGTVYAFPEHMLTGYAGNNNRASADSAESPFIQGRYRDQRSRSRRFKKLLKQIAKLVTRTSKLINQEWGDVEAGLSITISPPEIVTRDIKSLTESLALQQDRGWVSNRQAMNELRRDYEEIQAQRAEESEEAKERAKANGGVDPLSPQPNAVDSPGDQPGDGMPPGGGSPAKPKPGKPKGGGGETKTPDGTRGGDNEKKVKEDTAPTGVVFSGKSQTSHAKRLNLFEVGCISYSESFALQEHLPGKHDQKKHAHSSHGGGGIPDTSKWKKTNSAAQWGTKKIEQMKEAVAAGDADALKKMWEPSEAYKSGEKKMNQYQKGVWEAKQHFEAELAGKVTAKPVEQKGEWKKTGGQLGSNAGGKYIGPDGNEYYVKFPDKMGHASSEVTASKLYELAGAGVKPQEMVKIGSKEGVAGPWLPVQQVEWNATNKAIAAEDFAVHAWLANWDAVGLSGENIQSHDGKLKAIDVGGSLQFRAQGGHKHFGPLAEEWHTMRDAKVNGDSAAVFGKMTNAQLKASTEKLKHITPEDITKIVDAHYVPAGGVQKYSKADMTKVLLKRREAILAHGAKISADVAAINTIEPKVKVAKPAKGVVPPAMPAKPFASKSNQSYQKHFDAIHALGAKGDIEGLKAYKSNPTSKSTYVKKQHDFKMATLAALGAGADPGSGSAHVVKSPVKVPPAAKAKAKKEFKVDSSKLEVPPVFTTSNLEIKKLNTDLASKALKAAQDHDVEGLLKIKAESKSGKLGDYVTGLHNQVASQKARFDAGPPKPVVPYDKKALATAAKVKDSVKLKEVGYWTVHSQVKSPEHYTTKSWLIGNKNKDLMDAGEKSMEAAKLSKSEIKAVKAYTGGSYDSINQAMREPGKSLYDKQSYINQGNELKEVFKKSAVDLPEGFALGRRHTMEADVSKLQVGDVMSDAGFLSTSTSKTFWHYPVHVRMETGPGVKGLPVDNVSSNKGEREVILAPKQRMVVTKVEKVPPAKAFSSGDKWVVHAKLLPTLNSALKPTPDA